MPSNDRRVTIPDVQIGESLLEVISIIFAGRSTIHHDPTWGPMLDEIDGLAPSPGTNEFMKILDPNGVCTNFGIGRVLGDGDLPGDYTVIIDTFDDTRAPDDAS